MKHTHMNYDQHKKRQQQSTEIALHQSFISVQRETVCVCVCELTHTTVNNLLKG